MTAKPSAKSAAERWTRARTSLGSALAVCALLYGAEATGLLAPLELAARDAALALRLAVSNGRPAGWLPPIVLVRIGEEDIQRYGHPIPDAVLASALERILAGAPRAVGVDLYRDRPVGEGREALAALSDEHPEIVWVEKLADSHGVRVAPPSFVRRSAQIGFSDLVVDPDQHVRRALLYAWDDRGDPHAALGLRLALAYLAREAKPVTPEPADEADVDPRRPLRLGRGSLARFLGDDGGYVGADDGGYQILRDFRTGPAALESVSFGEIFEKSADAARFSDRIVLIGTVSPSVSDRFAAAAARSDDSALPAIAGVELHALIADRVLRVALRGDSMEAVPSPRTAWIAMLAIAIAGGFAGVRLHSPGRLAAALGATIVAGVVAAIAASAKNVWLPVPTALLCFTGASALGVADGLRRERSDRAIVDRMLTSHVSRPVRDHLWEQRDRFLRDGRLQSRHATVTILFADLVGFTAFAEDVPPATLMRWLGECMRILSRVVEENGGIIDDFWGDGLKANFGAPIVRETRSEIEQDARRAVLCALRFDRELVALAARSAGEGVPLPRMRVGIHTGPAILGSLGSDERQKLTTVGDTVNVASRLESILREPAGAEESAGTAGFMLPSPETSRPGEPQLVRILASEETVACLAGAFRTECLGEHPLKGRTRKVVIHRILGEAPSGGGCTL